MLMAVKHESNGDGFSVLIFDPEARLSLWVDVWHDPQGELECDWNGYIFNEKNSEEMRKVEYQRSWENFDACSSEAIEYLTKLGLV